MKVPFKKADSYLISSAIHGAMVVVKNAGTNPPTMGSRSPPRTLRLQRLLGSSGSMDEPIAGDVRPSVHNTSWPVQLLRDVSRT